MWGHGVDSFLDRHPGFQKKVIQYQEHARKAAADPEVQQDFYRYLANLKRHLNIHQQDIWNYNEKGITMGHQGARYMAIVQVGGRAVCVSDGTQEFCSVLETINPMGVVLPPFIVWQGRTHRESYYKLEETGSTNAHSRHYICSFT